MNGAWRVYFANTQYTHFLIIQWGGLNPPYPPLGTPVNKKAASQPWNGRTTRKSLYWPHAIILSTPEVSRPAKKGSEENVSRPMAIANYNRIMSGVNRFNQLREVCQWLLADNHWGGGIKQHQILAGSLQLVSPSNKGWAKHYLLWSACRHHIGEIVLTRVFQDLRIESSKSPDVTVFCRFRKHFDVLPHSSDQRLSTFDSSQFSEEAKVRLAEFRARVPTLSKLRLLYQRGDYKEFAQLCILFLGGSEEVVTFKRPGALHKARWMAKLIYSIKISLLEKYINQ